MNPNAKPCQICGEGHLEPRIGKNRVEYESVATELDLHCSVCDACGSEQGNATQMRENKRAMTRFMKAVDGLLTGSEVRKATLPAGRAQSTLPERLAGFDMSRHGGEILAVPPEGAEKY